MWLRPRHERNVSGDFLPQPYSSLFKHLILLSNGSRDVSTTAKCVAFCLLHKLFRDTLLLGEVPASDAEDPAATSASKRSMSWLGRFSNAWQRPPFDLRQARGHSTHAPPIVIS